MAVEDSVAAASAQRPWIGSSLWRDLKMGTGIALLVAAPVGMYVLNCRSKSKTKTEVVGEEANPELENEPVTEHLVPFGHRSDKGWVSAPLLGIRPSFVLQYPQW